jgi:hypothetical protein
MPKITFKTRTELAHEYGIDRKTFIRTLSREGILLPKGIVTSTWVKIIYETLGPPPSKNRIIFRFTKNDDPSFPIYIGWDACNFVTANNFIFHHNLGIM